jgi:osomolarity two-component system sensor histidine kinase NIK1
MVTHDHSADRTPPAEWQNLSTAARANGMTISLDGLPSSIDRSKAFSRAYGSMKAASLMSHHSSTSAPPTAYAHCPTCGKSVSDPLRVPIYASSSSSSPDVPLGSSPFVIPMGPLAAAAFESGMSAVEELKLLNAQVQDVARVCNAVARGDLSQKITVPVQGVVMVQLKDVINTMVCVVFF